MRLPSRERSIAINAAIIGERPTGLGVYAIHVTRALALLGERITVYTSNPHAIGMPGVETRRAPAAVRPDHGTRGNLARLLWLQTGLRARLMRERPRLLLSLMSEGLFHSPVPQIITVHDLVPLHYPQDHPRLRYYFRYFVPAVVRRSRIIITLSETSRQDIIRMYGVVPEKVHVAPCGYDAQRFNPYGPTAFGPDGDKYALYVGNVMPHKNLVRLVDAFAAIARRASVRLLIRGWGRRPHVDALRQRIAERGIGERVDWQPWADSAALPALYRGAHMVLLPSLAEGFGLTALEAMACGTPVVTSSRSAMPEVVGDAALLVDPLDTSSIADAMARLFDDHRLAKDLFERGRSRAARFTWERTALAVQGAVRAALGPSRQCASP
jgi:glycosyltransferase involved in cell wall biosynthesis